MKYCNVHLKLSKKKLCSKNPMFDNLEVNFNPIRFVGASPSCIFLLSCANEVTIGSFRKFVLEFFIRIRFGLQTADRSTETVLRWSTAVHRRQKLTHKPLTLRPIVYDDWNTVGPVSFTCFC